MMLDGLTGITKSSYTGDDLISKAEVLETYSELYWFDSDCEVVSKAEVDKIYERLQSLPSADRPTGEWVEKDGECVCSECGNSVSFSWTEDGWVLGKFCQTCGARMYKGGDSK